MVVAGRSFVCGLYYFLREINDMQNIMIIRYLSDAMKVLAILAAAFTISSWFTNRMCTQYEEHKPFYVLGALKISIFLGIGLIVVAVTCLALAGATFLSVLSM